MVEKSISYPYYSNTSWSEAWASGLFRRKVVIGVLLFASILLILPQFFSKIEARQGIVLNDWLLQRIPSMDFSVVIFILVWSTCLLILARCIQQPAIFLMTLYFLIIITLARIITISIIPLDPPNGLIILKDPLTSLTYGGTSVFITKDLFFSGHTANLFMFYLCLQKKRDKLFALFTSLLVGLLVLVQHVHYSIDVIGAFVFTYLLVKYSKYLGFIKL
jgi:membrane-associated phospholipid phosphatase